MAGIGKLNANAALNQLALNQGALQKSSLQLATGKAINSAADDPSGLAIYEALSSQAAGFDQGSQNAQDALNATAVAQGATQTISDILQNISVLSVQASNDFLGATDRQSLQANANQQIQQLNSISNNTNFNGANLLSGQFSGGTAAAPSTATVTSNDLLQSTTGNVVNTATPVSVTAGTPSETVLISVNAGQADVAVVDTNTGLVTSVGSFGSGAAVSAVGVNFQLGFFGPNDSGTASIQTSGATQFSPGSPASVQTGASQGATTQLNFPTVSSSSLGVSNINFATTANAQNSEGVTSQAITQLSVTQGELGAQTQALAHSIGANNNQAVLLTNSASHISDAGFAHTVTDNTLEQLQNVVTLNVLNNANTTAGFLSALLNYAA